MSYKIMLFEFIKRIKKLFSGKPTKPTILAVSLFPDGDLLCGSIQAPMTIGGKLRFDVLFPFKKEEQFIAVQKYSEKSEKLSPVLVFTNEMKIDLHEGVGIVNLGDIIIDLTCGVTFKVNPDNNKLIISKMIHRSK